MIKNSLIFDGLGTVPVRRDIAIQNRLIVNIAPSLCIIVIHKRSKLVFNNMVTYKSDLSNVDWDEMKTTLKEDAFDNGRSPQQLKVSFENSYGTCIAYIDNRIVGTARVLSDGVCNAYIVDVWTFTPYRRQGIASKMMSLLLEKLAGQHVSLFTDDAQDFYKKLGFSERETFMEKVIGKWLINHPHCKDSNIKDYIN